MIKNIRSKQAVSEVIGVVLLLGITISLFAVLNFYVFHFSINPSVPSVDLIFGPDHTIDDIIGHLREEGIIFAGDFIFLYSTPLGIEGSFDGWVKNLDAMATLGAKVYIPGHGPVCGAEGLNLCRDYLIFVQREARKRFDKGMTVDESAKDIELGQFKQWPNRERILLNLERLWREFRGEDPATSKLNLVEVFLRMDAMVKAGELW